MSSFAVYEIENFLFEIGYDDNFITYIKIRKLAENNIGVKNFLTDNAATQIKEYLRGKRKSFNLPYKLNGTEFQNKVWQALLTIPYSETRTYKQIAALIGNDKSSRAVGMANNKNPLLLILPCHRVIGTKGDLVGYAGGLDMKRFLLLLEQNYK